VVLLAGVIATAVAVTRPSHLAPEGAVPTAGGGATPTATAATPSRPAPPAATGTTLPSCAAAAARLPVRRQLAQLLLVGVDPSGPGEAMDLVRREQVGGIFLGGTATGLLADHALARVHASSDLPLFVAVDEEGGRVQRIDALAGSTPSARTMAATLSTRQVHNLALARGQQLRRLGVTVDFAPVVDVSSQPADAVIGDRSFSASPVRATRYAEAFAAGLRESGVLPVLKHFPGHGHARGDSHRGPATTPPLASMRTDDLVPYRSLPAFGRVGVMVGHLGVPGLTNGQPASLSPAAYRLLRREYAFDGVAFTDDLGSMRAITERYDLSSAVLQAIRAGADVALWTSGGGTSAVLDRLSAALASGELPRERVAEAVRRVLKAKSACG
jgi:beta-N-acetylhexosaminidase